MLAQVLNLAQKELIQTIRDRVLVTFLILGPVLQFLLLAQVAGNAILHLSLAVLDEDKSSTSRQIIAALDNTAELDLLWYPASHEELEALLSRGEARIGLIIPPNFAADLSGGRPTSVQVLADGANYLEAATALQASQGAMIDLVSRGIGTAATPPGVELRTLNEYNPGLNMRLHTLPAQIGLIVLEISLLAGALGIARERELGTLEQIRMTPIGNGELLLGKGLFAVGIGFVNFGLVLAASVWGFALPMRGSYAELIAVSLLFVAANAAMGLLLSVISGSQQQALLLVFLLCVLQVTVSGYLLNVNNMPEAFQAVAEFSPLRHYLTSIREIMIKGTPLESLASHSIAAVALTAGYGAAAWLLLTRQTD